MFSYQRKSKKDFMKVLRQMIKGKVTKVTKGIKGIKRFKGSTKKRYRKFFG
jgi:hypothetical protein